MLPDIDYFVDRMTKLLLNNDHLQDRSTAMIPTSDYQYDRSVVTALDKHDNDSTRTTQCLSKVIVCATDRPLWHRTMMTIFESLIVTLS